jgi:hypothetical protein
MKLLIAFSLLTLSFASFANDKKSLVGENVSGYSQCMKDTVDCTSGCEKKCENLNPEQYRQDIRARSAQSNKKNSAGKQ